VAATVISLATQATLDSPSTLAPLAPAEATAPPLERLWRLRCAHYAGVKLSFSTDGDLSSNVFAGTKYTGVPADLYCWLFHSPRQRQRGARAQLKDSCVSSSKFQAANYAGV